MRRVLILAAMTAAPFVPPNAQGPLPDHLATAGAPPTTSLRPSRMARTSDNAPLRVSIETSDRLQLVGSFFPPKSSQSPAALLIHGAGADRDQLEKYAQRLQKVGFGVLTFDLRGHGDSKTSSTNWEKLGGDERRGLWAQGIRDIEAAADWLLDQKQIHRTNLSLLAYGSGCALAARHAKEDENVVSLALLDPKPKDMGFDVQGDLEYLNGLPTFVVSPADDAAVSMVREANSLAGGHPYVEHLQTQRKASTALEDRKVPAKVSTWMRDMSRPRKGN